MAFIINKKSKRLGKVRDIYYLVENYREGNKVKRRKLLALSIHKSVAELLEAYKRKEALFITSLAIQEKKLDMLITERKYQTPFPLSRFETYEIIKKRLTMRAERAKIALVKCQKTIEHIRQFM